MQKSHINKKDTLRLVGLSLVLLICFVEFLGNLPDIFKTFRATISVLAGLYACVFLLYLIFKRKY